MVKIAGPGPVAYTITTPQILKILYLLSWIIFVGVCIEAGGFIFNAIFTLTINPIAAKHFWQEVDLSGLYAYDHGHFFGHDDKLNMEKPFSRETLRFIFSMSYIALLIGLFSWWGVKYSEWLTKQGVKMPGIQYLRLDPTCPYSKPVKQKPSGSVRLKPFARCWIANPQIFWNTKRNEHFYLIW